MAGGAAANYTCRTGINRNFSYIPGVEPTPSKNLHVHPYPLNYLPEHEDFRGGGVMRKPKVPFLKTRRKHSRFFACRAFVGPLPHSLRRLRMAR